MGFEWLKDLLEGAWEAITPVFKVAPDEGGVVLHYHPFGVHVRTIGPGLHFKLPLLGAWTVVNTAITTQQVGPQSLVTLDGRAFVVSAVLKYRVKDPRPLCVDVTDEIDALKDVASSTIKHSLTSRNWKTLTELNGELEREILHNLRAEVNGWGFKLYSVTLVDFSPMKSLRLLQEPQMTVNTNVD